MGYFAYEKSVGAVIYRQVDNDFLFLLVRYRSWQWDFPKGHVEPGETEEETMRREIWEETKLDDLVVLPNFRQTSRYYYVAKGNEKRERERAGRGIYIFKKAVYFAAKTEMEKVVIDFENKDFAWLPFQQVMAKLSNPGSKKIMEATYKALQTRKN